MEILYNLLLPFQLYKVIYLLATVFYLLLNIIAHKCLQM